MRTVCSVQRNKYCGTYLDAYLSILTTDKTVMDNQVVHAMGGWGRQHNIYLQVSLLKLARSSSGTQPSAGETRNGEAANPAWEPVTDRIVCQHRIR